MGLRYIETRSTCDVITEVYRVDEDPERELRVSRPLIGGNNTLITMWAQPHRAWDGNGQELRKKTYRLPLSPLTAEQAEDLALLFKELGITPPPTSSPAPAQSAGKPKA